MVNSRGKMAVLVGAVLFPLVAFSAAMIFIFDRHVRDDAEQAMRDSAQVAATVVHGYVTRQVAALEGLAAGSAAGGSIQAPTGAALERTLGNNPDWLGVAVLAGSDRLLVEAGNVSHDAIRAAGRDERTLDAVHVSENRLGEPFFLRDFSAYHGDQLAYRLLATVRAWPVTLALKSSLPPGTLVCVVDGNGNVVSLTKLKQPLGGIIGNAPTDSVVAGLAQPHGTLFEATLKGGDKVYAVATAVPGTNWTLLAGAPKERMDAPRRHAEAAVVIGSLSAGTLAFVLLLGIFRLWRNRDHLELQLVVAREREVAERRLSDIAGNFPGIIFRRIQKADGTVEHPFVGTGGTDTAISGRQFADMIDMIVPEDRPGWRQAWDRSICTGEPLLCEGRAMGSDGQVRWVRCAANLHNEGGDLVWDGVVTDVTAQKEREQIILQAKENAEAASAAKTKFLATASHDLRQPIQSLLLFTEALNAKLRDHQALPLLDKMRAALDTLKSMLNNLLDLSKIEAKMIEPDLRTVDVEPLVRRLFDTFEPRFAKAGLRFRCFARPAWVQTDPNLLLQILGNLLDNALKYTPKGGVLLACRNRGGVVRIQVVDTGVGIATKDQELIFGEFVQVGEVGREHRQGLGLGLATVKALCGLIDCRLSLASRLGRGSVFTVDLPATAPALSVVPPDDAGTTRSHRVLVVDDEDFIVEGMRALLESAGHQVLAAASLAEARKRIEEDGSPDVVLADYRLGPGANGMQVIEDIRTKVGPVPAAIITGDTEVAKLVPRSARVTVLHKPLAAEDLRRVVEGMVARKGRG